jgi:phage terminase large subunit
VTTLTIQTPAWAEPILEHARYKGVYGGRGSGKSHTFAELMIERHIIDQSTRSVCIREVQRSLAQSCKRLLEDKILDMNVGSYFVVQQDGIKASKGDGGIVFNGMQNHTAESIKSLEGYDIAWVEEAQSLSQRSLDLLRPTIRKEQSELWFSWNPREATDPVDAFLRHADRPSDAVVIQVNPEDNPWFPQVLKAELEYDRRRDPDKYQHVWRGGYLCNSEARVFSNWRIEEFETPAGAVFYLGADWGFAADPTVLVRCYLDGRTLYVDREAYAVGCRIEDTPTLFAEVPDAAKWAIVADSARPETIDYMQRHGYPRIIHSVKGANSVSDGVEWLKSYDIDVHPRCVHTSDELTHYSWKKDPLTDRVLPILEDKKNHVIDALRYACEAVRRGAPAVKVRTQG